MEKLHLNMENDINYLSWVTAIPKLVSLFFGITTSNCSKLLKGDVINIIMNIHNHHPHLSFTILEGFQTPVFHLFVQLNIDN